VNDFGVIETEDFNLYLPHFAFNNRYSVQWQQEQKFQFRPGKINIPEFINLFVQAYGENGVAGILFLYGAVFRDIIFTELEFFPYLFLFGDFGVGKTSFTEILLSVFYNNYKGISLEANSTPKSIARTANRIRNGLIYLKEFNHKIERSIQGLLKTGYEGVAYSRAQTSNDNKTHDTFINSAIILDGNSLPSGSSAQYSRMIILYFQKSKFSEEQTKAYNMLTEYASSGLGLVLIDILANRKKFENNFRDVFNRIFQKVKLESEEFKNVPERLIKHIAMFLAIYEIVDGALKEIINYQDLLEILANIILEQDQDLSRINRISQFWETFDYLKASGYVKNGIHYKYATKTDGDEFIALNLSMLHKLYKRNIISLGGEDIEYNDLLRLIRNDPAFIPSWMNGRGNSIIVKGLGSAYAFDINKINLNLEIWEK
ncbi:MAG TPA: hypothetical protein VE912_00240, partial [Bacteroidales bacterium]|nr:hypothetical protein [Bacteroidales bacterium]